MLLGLTLAIGFPNRLFQTVIFVVGTASILELLQIIDPGRHARFLDALVKAAAGIAGVASVIVLRRIVIRLGLGWPRLEKNCFLGGMGRVDCAPDPRWR